MLLWLDIVWKVKSQLAKVLHQLNSSTLERNGHGKSYSYSS